MKLQLVHVNIYDRAESTVEGVVEVNTFEEAVRALVFNEGATDEDVQEYMSEFVETDTMFICDGDELSIMFFKLD